MYGILLNILNEIYTALDMYQWTKYMQLYNSRFKETQARQAYNPIFLSLAAVLKSLTKI